MIASNDILSNPANFTPPMRTSLFYAAHVEVADRQTDTSTDNKGRLKLSSRANQLNTVL